jgi:hypothetical protein
MISSKAFSFDKSNLTFYADVSEVTIGHGLRLERIYPDACDAGFTMMSEKTGRTCRFVEVAEERDAEGDVILWRFDAVDKIGKGCRVVLFND